MRRPTPTTRSALTTAALLTLAAMPVYGAAVNGTWTKDATGTQNWSTTGNWSGGTVADDTDGIATLGNVITADRTITLDTARTIGSISALDADKNYTISGANMLTLDVSSGQSTLDVTTSGRTLTISTPVTVNDGILKTGAGAVSITGAVTLGGTQTWTNNSAGALSTSNGTNLITNGGFDLTVGGTGNTNFGVINNAAAAITGSGNLIKNGTGVLSLGGTNAGFSGNVTVNGGVVRVNAAASINGNVNLTNGIYEEYWTNTYNRTLGSASGQIQITGGTSGFSENGATGMTVKLNNNAAFEVVWGSALFNPTVFVLQAATAQSGSTLDFQNKIDLNAADRTVQVSQTSGSVRATISGQIRNSSGTAGFTKTGAGILLLTNNSNAWNGDTTVSGGMLDLGGANLANIGGGSGRNITVASGAAIRFNTLSNAVLNRIVETTDEIGIMSGGTANNFDFSSSTGANLPNAFLGNYATNGAKAEFSGTITPGSNGYKLGAKFNSGLLGLTNTSAMTGTNSLTIGTGSVQLVGAKTFTGDTTIRSGARLGLAAFTGGSEALGLQNSVFDVGAAGGNFWLHNSTATGPITGSANTTSAVFGGLKGSRNLSTVYSTTTGANNSAAQAVTAITGFTLNVGTGNTVTYSGAIGGFGTGASGGLNGASTLTKTGNGTQILTGVSTYAGATTITGGTLAINGAGSINGSNVTINGGTLAYNSSVNYSQTPTFTAGTLAGTNWNGTLSGLTIGTGQTISPGNSPGTATTGSQTWASGGTLLWEINNATGSAGTDPGWDLLSGTGTLDITATSGSEFTIEVTSLTLANAAGAASNFDDTQDYAWRLADFGSAVTGFNASDFVLDTTAFTNAFTGTFGIARGDTVLGGDDTQVYLTYTAVPEPTTLGLLGLGAVGLMRRRRVA